MYRGLCRHIWRCKGFWGFPNLGIPFWVRPHNKDDNNLGSILWGPHMFGNYHIKVFITKLLFGVI